MSRKHAQFVAILSGLSLLVSCGGSGKGSVPAPTATLTASPTTLIAGQGFSTLMFTSTNADVGIIDNGEGGVGLNGHVTVTPTVTTTYTYTASGPGGSATAQATITVTPTPPAPAVTLSASPSTIFAGQSTTLTWTSTNATTLNIENFGQVSASGSQLFDPTQTTSFTINAFGNGQQGTATATVTVTPVNSFDGMAQYPGFSSSDVDPNGAVGTMQFMEYVNTQYQAFNKVTFQPVAQNGTPGPLSIGTPWNSINPPSPCATGIPLDAVINFDRLASRWVIAAKSFASNHYFYCIAVSNTDDLSSSSLAWYAYSYDLTLYLPTDPTTHAVFDPDWTKLGTWPDAYYATMDLLDGGVEAGVLACAFDRTNILINAAPNSNQMQCFNITVPIDSGIALRHSLIPADVEGTTPPPPGRDEFMVSIENPPPGSATPVSNTINVWDFHVDWTSSAKSNFNLVSPSPMVPSYTPGCFGFDGFPAITNCVLEPSALGIAQFIDSVGDRLMPRLAYRNFGTYESFLISHTVQTGSISSPGPTLQTGIRWYELRGNFTGTPFVYQSGTVNPDDVLFRFLPSIAQDKDGNAAVGYSISNVFTDPGIFFSYWNLTTNSSPGEVAILNGNAEEVTSPTQDGLGPWGSYSSMTVDPVDDCTFWYVNEYFVLPSGQTNSSWVTRIANFKMPSCQ